MITSLAIANHATFGPVAETFAVLKKFNYLYGPNGSGKTTISRLINGDITPAGSSITWKNGTKLQTYVYNRDFVEKNFSASAQLKGVFTLGEKDAKVDKELEELKAKLDDTRKKIAGAKSRLNGDGEQVGLNDQIKALEEKLILDLWVIKTKYNTYFQDAFKGLHKDKVKFKERVLLEHARNKAESIDLETLKEKALRIFQKEIQLASLIPQIVFSDLISLEDSAILAKSIIGKEDVDIATMIDKLGNSDWVKEGRTHFEANNGICPFCQQKVQSDFATSLNEYFNEAYTKDMSAIEILNNTYKTECETVLKLLDGVIDSASPFLDLEQLKSEKDVLITLVSGNQHVIAQKKKEPSTKFTLQSVNAVCKSILSRYTAANEKVKEHNRIVNNIETEKTALTSQIWRYLLDNDLQSLLVVFSSEQARLQKEISGYSANLSSQEGYERTHQTAIRLLEANTTSINPTITEINAFLKQFAFTSFSLDPSSDGRHYRLIRANGQDAKETLSEGEKTFITFLYFFHLLNGSHTDAGTLENRIVVFDDPISSLDSDVLFIISSLMKKIIARVEKNIGPVQQVFVLTHNVYFYKEVTFNMSRQGKDKAAKDETFWTIKKSGPLSKIVSHSSIPIKNSYELLWGDIRKPDLNSLTIQNTMRRILENYFKILGNISTDDICSKFTGADQLICRTLVSWINDGSHFANDDLFVSTDESIVDKYLDVFHRIFEGMDHEGHYKMMMGDAYVPNEV